MNQLRVVLVDPRFAANIGFTARVCTNFGVQDFRAVSSKPERWHWEEARKIAVPPASQTLESLKVHRNLLDAIADCHLVIGFTRRFGEDRRPELTPGSVATLMNQFPSKKIALLFGNEETGLTEDETRPCSHLCIIPTSAKMPSMNVSHAIAAVLARLHEDTAGFFPRLQEAEETAAKSSELDGLFSHWREFMIAAGMTQAGNPDRILKRVERIFHRNNLSSREVKILRGILAKSLLRVSGKSST